jgi:NDP-sugar pyrophosphorylase family protein
MKTYRALTIDEIVRLKAQACVAEDWNQIQVTDGFRTEAIYDVRFSGQIRMGAFDEDIVEHDGMVAYSGIRHATLHNVTVGDGCLIENVGSFISNYQIGDQCYIRNIGSMQTTGTSAFGNGVVVNALKEDGTSAFPICAGLPAPVAYMMATTSENDEEELALRKGLQALVRTEAEHHTSDCGQVGDGAFICDVHQMVNVNVGSGCVVNGASRLANGSLLNEGGKACSVGTDVIAQDFILSGGASLDNGAILTRCFVGQGSYVGNRFTATDTFIASNCHFENGEACSVFAGPYTVSHHKNTLLIGGMFSFMNAGSGTNQSNHLYKAGPIHWGELQRGCKTSSDSYLMWPAKVGAYSLVMGRVKQHPDTRIYPFSYLIENGGKTYLKPGANAATAGTWRDALKWPKRDKRVAGAERDLIRFDILNPFVMQYVMEGTRNLRIISGFDFLGEEIKLGSLPAKRESLATGINRYDDLLVMTLAKAFAHHLQRRTFSSPAEFQEFIRPKSDLGQDEWVDLAGFIAPREALNPVWNAVAEGQVEDLDELLGHLKDVDSHYDEYVWNWASPLIPEVEEWDDPDDDGTFSVQHYLDLVEDWSIAMQSVTNLVANEVYKDLLLAQDGNFKCHPFIQQMQQQFADVKTTVQDVMNCIGEHGDE